MNQSRADATTPLGNANGAESTTTTVSSTVSVTTTLTTTTKAPRVETILPEKLILSENDNKFAEYKQSRVDTLRNKTSDSDVTINDIKDDDLKTKNVSVVVPRAQPAIDSIETLTTPTVEPNEKRSKSLVDPITANNTTPSNDLISHRVVGDLNSNNVTLGRSNEAVSAGKVEEVAENNNGGSGTVPPHEESSTNANSEGLLLKNNSSRIDDTVHQDISIVQVTTVAPRPNRIASITRKEVESKRMADVALFNATNSNVTKERLVKVESAGHVNQPNLILNASVDKKAPVEPADHRVRGGGGADVKYIEALTTAEPIAETTEMAVATEITTIDVNDGQTTETPEKTTILDELTTTNTPAVSTAPPQTSHNNRSAALTERTIPKIPIAAAEVTTPAAAEMETTPIYSTTIANRMLNVDEQETTIFPEVTFPPSRSTHGPSPTELLRQQGSTWDQPSVSSVAPTKPMEQSSTTTQQAAVTNQTTVFTTTTTVPTTVPPSTTASTTTESTTTIRSTTANKMKMEISTTEISLNRLEDKYSTEVDGSDKKQQQQPSPTSISNFEDPLEESTLGMGNIDEEQDASSEAPVSANSSLWDSMDVNGIIVVGVSVVGIVALILLVGFLFIMRKRQKQMTYGQRCRPVGLDAYSLDNISVYNSVRRKGTLRSSKRAYGNAGFDDPSLKNNLLNIPALASFVQKRTAIYDEFKDVPLVTARIDEVPVGCEDKNR